jgi:4a-hydroxytetrahydrobiopterin dehydratase
MPGELAEKKCIPCGGDTPPLWEEESDALLGKLEPGWRFDENRHLIKKFRFSNFRRALDFANRVGALAEQEGHHPNIHVGWGTVEIELWTHIISGLSENDFIVAAKIDTLLAQPINIP